ncbi:unnamed protein product [Adineta steineri]|uniref:Uncharacterized protein n=1 Tax=Adineta steineri TaxID=433720 RepID=A0A819XF89_9BILA|nr:unnamed protein product [Adineta steineri]CAF4140147.1 unnamed protein product [Adineta steineri]
MSKTDPRPTKLHRNRCSGKRMMAIFFMKSGLIKPIPLEVSVTPNTSWSDDIWDWDWHWTKPSKFLFWFYAFGAMVFIFVGTLFLREAIPWIIPCKTNREEQNQQELQTPIRNDEQT